MDIETDIQEEMTILYEALEKIEARGFDPVGIGAILITAVHAWCEIHGMDDKAFFESGIMTSIEIDKAEAEKKELN